MPASQPEHTGQTDQQNRASIRKEDDVDEILCHTEAQDGKDERESNDEEDYQALLPWFSEQARVELTTELLDERDHGITSGDHHQHTGPPGAEASEKAQECAKGLVGPDINRAFTREHQAQLPGDDGAWDEECEKAKTPVNKGCRTCTGYNASITDKEDDCNEDGDHVECVQDSRENAPCDTLGTQGLAATTFSSCCHGAKPPI